MKELVLCAVFWVLSLENGRDRCHLCPSGILTPEVFIRTNFDYLVFWLKPYDFWNKIYMYLSWKWGTISLNLVNSAAALHSLELVYPWVYSLTLKILLIKFVSNSRDGVNDGILWLVDCIKRNCFIRPPIQKDITWWKLLRYLLNIVIFLSYDSFWCGIYLGNFVRCHLIKAGYRLVSDNFITIFEETVILYNRHTDTDRYRRTQDFSLPEHHLFLFMHLCVFIICFKKYLNHKTKFG